MKKIGIYGGSFNPIHLGHEKIAKFVLKELNLDKLIIVPVGIPSHRANNLAEADFRLKLCKKIFENNDKIEVSDIEVRNNTISYTYDTLLKLKQVYGENEEYYEIIGEDSLEYFEKWKNYEKILENSKLVVLKRKNSNLENLKIFHPNIIFLNNNYYNFSSTEIRNKIKNNEDISSMVNKKILILLKENLKTGINKL